MPSPFPGMDPWLEATDLFPDVHGRLTISLADAINVSLPGGYFAATETITWVDTTTTRRTIPDVTVAGPRWPAAAGAVAVLDAATALQPLGVKLRPLDWKQRYVEIRTAQGKRVVTAVEFVSRANKAPGAGRKAYLDKLDEFSLGGVNVVEIDLLRAGPHVTAAPRERLEQIVGGPFHYHVCVTMAGRPEQLFGAVFPLTRPLPAIDIPLDPGVPPVRVELQPLLDRAYDAGRFSMRAEYDQPPDPPLSPEDQAWADSILKSKYPTPETP